MGKSIRMNEIAALASLSGDGFGATIRGDRVALTGQRDLCRLPSGLRLHTLDARAETDFETRATRRAGLVLHLVLEGGATAWIGDMRLDLDRRAGAPVRLGFSASRAAVPFRRIARAGAYLRKVNIALDWGWLSQRGLTPDLVLQGAALRQGYWTASLSDITAGERLVVLDRGAQGVAGAGCPTAALFEREALAMGLIHQLAGHLAEETGAPARTQALRPGETERLARMEARAVAAGPMPTLDEIAAAGGMSLSSAQRLFRRAHGVPAMTRLRGLRLTLARDALTGGASVADAARLAGFASAESFSTACRRAFGRPPSRQAGPGGQDTDKDPVPSRESGRT